jgi:Reverse transcriptase (RNA-dependent DNA polymerase)
MSVSQSPSAADSFHPLVAPVADEATPVTYPLTESCMVFDPVYSTALPVNAVLDSFFDSTVYHRVSSVSDILSPDALSADDASLIPDVFDSLDSGLHDFDIDDDEDSVLGTIDIAIIDDLRPLSPTSPGAQSPVDLSPLSDTAFLDDVLKGLPPVLHALHGTRSVFGPHARSKASCRRHSTTLNQGTYDFAPDGSLLRLQGHIDGGSLANCTNHRSALFGFRSCSGPALQDAGDHIHRPVGRGWLKLPVRSLTSDCPPAHLWLDTWYVPSIGSTIISPTATGRLHGCSSYSTFASLVDHSVSYLRLHHCTRRSGDVDIAAHLHHGLLFTTDFILPSLAERSSRPDFVPALCLASAPVVSPVRAVSRPCTCLPPCCAPCSPCAPSSTVPDSFSDRCLWMMRLGAQADVRIDDMHRHSRGVPDFTPVGLPSYSCGSHCPTADAVCTPSAFPPSLLDPGPALLVRHLSREQLRILWHHRLGHLNSRRASDFHRFAIGVPALPIADELAGCPVCAEAKLTKSPRSTDDSRRATQCFQGLSIDFGFIVQQSSDTDRYHRYLGLNGESCYVLITDHFSGAVFGSALRSKAPPLDYLNGFLATKGLGSDVPDKYVRFDLGGELARCPDIVALFTNAGYRVEPTAADASHQNGPVERVHRTIGNALRAMLTGADLDPKFWPYAFTHYLRLYNFTPHGTHAESPYTILHGGDLPDLHSLRTFGCRVYAVPRKARPAKLDNDTRKGIFLGYAQTLKNILYFDLSTSQIRTTKDALFDEGMNDLAIKPPHARLLAAARSGALDALADPPSLGTALDLDVSTNPFSVLRSERIPVTCDDPHLGLLFESCSLLRRAYLSSVAPSSSAARVRGFKRRTIGAYVVSIDAIPVATIADVLRVLASLATRPDRPAAYEFVFAPERKEAPARRRSPLHLQLDQLLRVNAIQSVSGEGLTSLEYVRRLDAFILDSPSVDDLRSVLRLSALSFDPGPLPSRCVPSSSSVPSPSPLPVHRLHGDGTTPAEAALPSFTARHLKTLPNWSQWRDAFDDQLDAHAKVGTFGHPCFAPPGATVLRSHWNNLIKADGKRKCRLCADGSKRAAPNLHRLADTYASCIDQPCMRLFFALASGLGLILYGADCTNAYANAPSPTHPTYLRIDDMYADWYLRRFGVDVDRGMVLPVLKALQGHPEAGALWEKHIVNVLVTHLGFTATTHERNLYHGTFMGDRVYICRMVDDFAVATRRPEVASALIAAIGSCGDGIDIRDDGLLTKFNGVDISQTRDYVKLSCTSYLTRVLLAHGWDKPGARESDRHDAIPISDDTVKRLALLDDGPVEGTSAHTSLEAVMGFSFRQVLGELIYAYVVARLDIGFAITFLARFSKAPAKDHYDGLRGICKYLRRTIDWGILYWRDKPLTCLPAVAFDILRADDTLPPFPRTSLLLELVGYVDASHATDVLTRRSVTGIVFCLSGGAVAFKSKLQTSVSTSSTEAEFKAAVHAAKLAKYLRFVLADLGFAQQGPTALYEDNLSTIAMINSNRPTERSRHIDIQHFAIQEWKAEGSIVLRHIAGVINPADAATKPTSWVLHHRHVRRAMGHFGNPTHYV